MFYYVIYSIRKLISVNNIGTDQNHGVYYAKNIVTVGDQQGKFTIGWQYPSLTFYQNNTKITTINCSDFNRII